MPCPNTALELEMETRYLHALGFAARHARVHVYSRQEAAGEPLAPE